MTVLQWPLDAYYIGSEDFHLSGQTVSQGGVFGPGTVIHVENRVWRTTVDLGPLSQDRRRVVRSIFDQVRGQFGVISIPICDDAPESGAQAERTFDGGVTFTSGAVFAAEDLSGVTVAEDTAAGATMIALSVAPSLVKINAMFSLPGDRMHRVVGSTATHIQIEPPLRRALLSGDAVEFKAPRARMRLTIDNARLTRVASGLTAPTTFELVEAF